MQKLSLYRRLAIRILNQFFSWLPDRDFIKLKFYLYVGYWPNIDNPKSFNEKLQWLKLNTHDLKYSDLVDKIKVKRYISEQIGSQFIIPTLGVYRDVEEIDLSQLPDKFVLKCNHDSGGLTICKNKKTLNLGEVKRKLSSSLRRNYYKVGREWPYKYVEKAILAETLLEDGSDEIMDYKMFCFNGKVKCCLVCSDRQKGGVKMNFYDLEWNLLPFTRHYPNTEYPISKPSSFERMVELAEKLATPFPFVRIDFYDIKGRIYFGEMTFFPGNGWSEFTPVEWDYKLGEWLHLNVDEKE